MSCLYKNTPQYMIFTQDSVTISEGYEDNVGLYNISYKDSSTSTNNICSDAATIPAVECMDSGVCRHVFDASASYCSLSTNITVTVTATSMFGPGEESTPMIIGMVILFSMHQPATRTAIKYVYTTFRPSP